MLNNNMAFYGTNSTNFRRSHEEEPVFPRWFWSQNMSQNIPVDIAVIFSPINRRLTSWRNGPIVVNFLIWRWICLHFMILFYFRVIRVFFIKILTLLFTLQLLELIDWVEEILLVEERYRKKMNLQSLYFPCLKLITNSI